MSGPCKTAVIPVKLLGRNVIQVVHEWHTKPIQACRTCCFFQQRCPTRSDEEATGIASCGAMDRDRKFAHYEEVPQ